MRDIIKDVEYVGDLLRVLYGDKVPEIDEIKVSNRMTKTFGQCETHRFDDGWTRLTFASFILDERYPYNDYLNVVAHEYIHSIDRNKSGHGGEWLRMAKEVSDCYEFLGNIQRLVDIRGVEYRNKIKPKKVFKCKCEKCGKEYVREGYRCPSWMNGTYYHKNCYRVLKRIL